MTPMRIADLTSDVFEKLEELETYKLLTDYEKTTILKVAASVLTEKSTLDMQAIMIEKHINSMG